MEYKIRTEKKSAGCHGVYFEDKYIGQMIRDVDGYFYYFPSVGGGCFGSWELKSLAEELDNLNREWDKHITEYFRNQGG